MGIYPTIHHVVVISILITYTVHELQLETGVVGFKRTAVIKEKMVSKGFMFTVDDLIIIILINGNWVVTRRQWLFYMYTKYEIGY